MTPEEKYQRERYGKALGQLQSCTNFRCHWIVIHLARAFKDGKKPFPYDLEMIKEHLELLMNEQLPMDEAA